MNAAMDELKKIERELGINWRCLLRLHTQRHLLLPHLHRPAEAAAMRSLEANVARLKGLRAGLIFRRNELQVDAGTRRTKSEWKVG